MSDDALVWWAGRAADGDERAMRLVARISIWDGDLPAARHWFQALARAGSDAGVRGLLDLAETAEDQALAQQFAVQISNRSQMSPPVSPGGRMRTRPLWDYGELGRAEISDEFTRAEAAMDLDMMRVLALNARDGVDPDLGRRLMMRTAELGDAHTAEMLGAEAERAGAVEEAQRWYRVGADSGAWESDLGWSRSQCAVGLARLGDLEKAMGCLTREALSGAVHTMYLLGLALLDGGQRAAARIWLSRAAVGNAGGVHPNPGALEEYAQVLEDDGDLAQAAFWFERAADVHGLAGGAYADCLQNAVGFFADAQRCRVRAAEIRGSLDQED